MIIQIAGAVILTTSIICGTWYAVERVRISAKAANESARLREARNRRTFENEALMLYEDEKQRRIAAETRERIANERLRRAQETMKTVMIKEVR